MILCGKAVKPLYMHPAQVWVENVDITLYQFIFTTDEKPTVVYLIPDEIPTTLAFSHVNWCKIDVFTLNIMVLHHKMSQTINNNKNTK